MCINVHHDERGTSISRIGAHAITFPPKMRKMPKIVVKSNQMLRNSSSLPTIFKFLTLKSRKIFFSTQESVR